MAHRRARLTPFGRLLLVSRVMEQGWSVPAAAESLGVLWAIPHDVERRPLPGDVGRRFPAEVDGGGVDVDPRLRRFERARLELFARDGFDGESRWITDRKGRFSYVIGRGDGPHPTLLIHGGLSQAGEWSLLAGRLQGHVLIPDRPGCGLSYPIDYRAVDYRAAPADWLRDLIDGIGADQVDLVGNSTGGFFSMVFAIAYPHRVRRLALVGAPAGLHREVPLFVRLWEPDYRTADRQAEDHQPGDAAQADLRPSPGSSP